MRDVWGVDAAREIWMTDETKPLTNKQKLFIDYYLQCWNAAEAARRAGYSERSAYSQGWENLRKPEIQSAISARLDEAHMSADEALAILASHARGDIGEFLDISSVGFSLDLEEAQKKGITKLIKKIEQKVITINGKQEDKEIITTKIELHDPQAAARDVLKIHGRYKENVDVTSGGEPLKPQIDDERFNRAVSSLADALREIVPNKDTGADSKVDTSK